ncbi:alpha/beta fold hydrolase [Chondrinema litorale]|uniref:alpha/beta fold hydrolase n=1 Tax=Chondrinema litorale TaxID=2994555 RepID=UPI002542C5B5|nr:alpha/beta hydrolase [Chondrinema litorale]UZR98518.1 alpha/beta hydrolase [Chondrinema litorale]
MNNIEKYLLPISQFIEIDGMNVHYTIEGRGNTIVLMHGSGSSLHTFIAVSNTLKEHYQVLSLDLPGFGLTGIRPDKDYRIETYVSFLHKFLGYLSIKNFVLVGNSLGGNIAWNYAHTHFDQLNGLVLMNATGYPEKSLPLPMKMAKTAIGRFLIRRLMSRKMTEKNLRKLVGTNMTILDEEFVERVYTLGKANLDGFFDNARTKQKDNSPGIKEIKVPTLVLRGENVDGQHFAKDLPNSKEIIYPGTGHLLPDEIPLEIAASINSFVQSLL